MKVHVLKGGRACEDFISALVGEYSWPRLIGSEAGHANLRIIATGKCFLFYVKG